MITRPVTIRAAPGAAVEVSWNSSQPYEATVEVDGTVGGGLDAPGTVVLQGLRLRHSNPSVANNWAGEAGGSGSGLGCLCVDCAFRSTAGRVPSASVHCAVLQRPARD